MIRDQMLAFDDYIDQPSGASSAVNTSDIISQRLGQCDLMTFMVVVQDLGSGGTPANLVVQIQTSGDGHHWANKYAVPDATLTVAAFQRVVGCGYDDGSNPSLGHVRLAVTNQLLGAKLHVRIYVTLRDAEEFTTPAPPIGPLRGRWTKPVCSVTDKLACTPAEWAAIMAKMKQQAKTDELRATHDPPPRPRNPLGVPND